MGTLRGTGRIPISTTPFSSDFFLSAAAAISLRLAAVSGALGGVNSTWSFVGSSADLLGLGMLSDVLALGLLFMGSSVSGISVTLFEGSLLISMAPSMALGVVVVVPSRDLEMDNIEEEGERAVPAFPDVPSALVGVVLCLLSVCLSLCDAEGVSSLLRASRAFFTISSLLSLLSLLSLPVSHSDGEGK